MNEFIFSVEEIFKTVLSEAKVKDFHIPPYQRGYKWLSDTRYDQVPQMLIDVYSAYKQKTEEYYLQYITVQKNKEGRYDVIDGQQRLTTLSILLYRYAALSNSENIAKDKVNYSRHEESNIFEWVDSNFTSAKAEDQDSQDKYYMLKAANCINIFFEKLITAGELKEYMEYLLHNVKIILNEESEFVSAEETFANLNDNKVPLTNTYLIKGLLLTLAVYRETPWGTHASYKEVMDQRCIMGRMWDEIMAWIEQEKVSHYFFGQKRHGMERLLGLVDLETNNDNDDEDVNIIQEFSKELGQGKTEFHSELTLFNKYNESIKDCHKAIDILGQIKHMYRILKGIYDNYEDSTMYNKLGYLFFCKPNYKGKDRNELLKMAIKSDKNEFDKSINELLLKAIPEITEDNSEKDREKCKFNYHSSNDNLTNLLLSFSVFPSGVGKSYRFDFFQYDEENWSFEHIFPQHPKTEAITIPEVAVPIVSRAIENKKIELGRACEEGQETEEMKECDDAIKALKKDRRLAINKTLSFLYDANIPFIHYVGNMALLSGGANAAISNNPFVAKRVILQKKIQDGCFVPRHTIEVFNKLISTSQPNTVSMNPELHIWDENDIVAHVNWMIQHNKEIREALA